MPVGVPREIAALARSFGKLATPGSAVERAFLAAVRDELKPEIRKMYEGSTDPFGSAWTRDKDGRPAYRSPKMGKAISLKRTLGGLEVHEWVKWIRAADEGHEFPARQASHVLAYDKQGRLVRAFGRKRYFDGSRDYRKNVKLVTNADHAVGARVLPPRPQQPGGRMPDAWGAAINRGADKGMTDFVARATGNGGE